MKKLYLSRLIKLIALVVPIVAFVLLSQHYLFYYHEASPDRIRGFYKEEENSLDVVLLGASEVFTGFSPGHAYTQHGFTSYAYAIDSNPATLFQSELKEILSCQDPGLILVEVNGFLYTDPQPLADEVRLRIFAENIPMSLNKLETIHRFPCSDKASCLIPFIKYHSRWPDRNTLMKNLIHRLSDRNDPTRLKGIETTTSFYREDSSLIIDPSRKIGTTSEKHLIQFLEYCREADIQNILFINFPRHFSDERDGFLSRVANVEQIVKQYGYPFLNLQDHTDAMGLDLNRDFYNAHHLNIYGQRKLTAYLGELLITQYHLSPMEQTAENAARWEESGKYAEQFFSYAEQCFQEGQIIRITEESFLEYLNTGTP